MEVSVLLIAVLAGEAYIYIKGCQVMCLKLGQFIVYFIFNWVCGVEKREKEKGRVEEEWAPFAVNLGLQLALPSVREEPGGVQIDLGWHSAWFVVAYDAGNYKQCWIGYKSLEEALQCFSYLGLSVRKFLVAVIKSMARNNASQGRFLIASPWRVPALHSKKDIVVWVLYDWLHCISVRKQREGRSSVYPQWPTSPSNAPP